MAHAMEMKQRQSNATLALNVPVTGKYQIGRTALPHVEMEHRKEQWKHLQQAAPQLQQSRKQSSHVTWELVPVNGKYQTGEPALSLAVVVYRTELWIAILKTVK